jgi:hypothetical protein
LYLVIVQHFPLQSGRLWSSDTAQSVFPTTGNQFRDPVWHLRFISTYTISSNIRDRDLILMLGNSKKWKGFRKGFSAYLDTILKVPSTYLNFKCTKMRSSFTATLTTLIHYNVSAPLAAALYPVGAPSWQSVSHFIIMTETMTALYLWTAFYATFYSIVASSRIWLDVDKNFPVWKHTCNPEHAICLLVFSSLINFSLMFSSTKQASH